MSELSAQAAKDKCVEMISSGCSLEDVLGFLRNSGFSQGVSVFITERAYEIEHSEAKYRVVHSDVWSDSLTANLELQKHAKELFEDHSEK